MSSIICTWVRAGIPPHELPNDTEARAVGTARLGRAFNEQHQSNSGNAAQVIGQALKDVLNTVNDPAEEDCLLWYYTGSGDFKKIADVQISGSGNIKCQLVNPEYGGDAGKLIIQSQEDTQSQGTYRMSISDPPGSQDLTGDPSSGNGYLSNALDDIDHLSGNTAARKQALLGIITFRRCR